MDSLFTQDLYLKTWNFASAAHRYQTLPGSDIPYLNHIGNVAMEVIAAISVIPVQRPDLSIQCALLHDVIEDTDVTYEQVKLEFGEAVALGVLSLTKDQQLPSKKEQMLDSLSRIRQQPKEIWLVKLADRITNLQAPPAHWNKMKIANYRDEAQLIHDQLASAHAPLAGRLAQKIAEYRLYMNA
ncbi:HD domain-containing protein [Celerinatantimonas sp. YJH-8]|uniref:HD domain-containing protein n=1 Tax=Celerinatantimonas sp. YJH-8 TaxID=3228714 RepID=UPI0038C16E60